MTRPGSNRPRLLTTELHDALLDYLRFRHVFRSAYSFDLDWQKMAPLVLRVEQTLSELEHVLDRFLASGLDQSGPDDSEQHG